MKPWKFVAAWFIGSPVGFLASGAMIHFASAGVALTIGAFLALATGFAVLRIH